MRTWSGLPYRHRLPFLLGSLDLLVNEGANLRHSIREGLLDVCPMKTKLMIAKWSLLLLQRRGPYTHQLKWIRPFLIGGDLDLSSIFEPPKASAGILTMYSFDVFEELRLNWGLMSYSHSPFMISLIPALLRRSHRLPSRALQIRSKLSSMKMPPQRPPIPDRSQKGVSIHQCMCLTYLCPPLPHRGR